MGKSTLNVFVALLRGVNVGGNNMISMSALKQSLQASNRKPMVKAPAPAAKKKPQITLVKPRAAKKRKVG